MQGFETQVLVLIINWHRPRCHRQQIFLRREVNFLLKKRVIPRNDSVIIEDAQNDKELDEDPISIVNNKSMIRWTMSDLCNTDDESDLPASKPAEEIKKIIEIKFFKRKRKFTSWHVLHVFL